MNTYIYNIGSSHLQTLIPKCDIANINCSEAILMQLFSKKNPAEVKKIVNSLKTTFPKSTIITTSTDKAIIQNNISENDTVLSVSTFSKSTIKIAYNQNINGFDAGVAFAKQVITKNTKLLIAFAHTPQENTKEFLEGMYSLAPDIIMAGGISTQTEKSKQYFIGMNENIYTNGIVVASLNSDTLHVDNLYNFGWKSIGVKHKITKARNNRIYEIDNMSAVNFYKKYLGKEIADALPKIGTKFPLIIDKNGFQGVRKVLQKYKDGSLGLVHNVREGENIYLGISKNAKTLSSNKTLHAEKIEAFFIYSYLCKNCSLPNYIAAELQPFIDLAPTCGFFTYGHLLSNEKLEISNKIFNAIGLSESSDTTLYNNAYKNQDEQTVQALMHMLDIESMELQKQISKQEKKSSDFYEMKKIYDVMTEVSHIGNWELNIHTMKISWSQMSYKIYNINPENEPPSYLEFLNMVIPEDRSKLVNIQKKLYDKEIHSVEIRVQRPDGKILTIVETAKVIFNAKDEAKKLIGTTLDITDIRKQDAVLIQQSKSAQMGEMINMIAHQWRQPLNAISAAAIKFSMQSELGILTKEDVQESATFIEDMSQKMSQTINDFMNFNKPSNKKENANFHQIIQNILKIIGTQLKNHNISVNIDINDDNNIYTNVQEIEHILLNIITNARDALEELDDENKYINIKIYTKEHLHVIKIADNAGGIPEDIQGRIFEPYFTTKETNKGTGLGLYMSKKILQEHLNGDIYVNNINNGAEFTIILDQNNESS